MTIHYGSEKKTWSCIKLLKYVLVQLVIAFQGTKELRDYMASLRALPPSTDPTPVYRHQYKIANSKGDQILTSRQPGYLNPGWKACWRSVEAAVFDIVDRVTQGDPWWTIYTTGHSMGGALSTVAAEALATRHPECAPVSCVPSTRNTA